MVTVPGYMVIEGWNFIDSLYHTIINVVALGGVGEVNQLSTQGRLFTVFAKMFSFFCIGAMVYYTLQASLFERVDRLNLLRIQEAKKKPINIFVSYRRADSSGYAGRIYDRLSSFFGSSHVFMDVDTIAPGEDFSRMIQSSISACDIMVAVIGVNWIGDEHGAARIFNSTDFVRMEIECAIRNHIQIIPILVNDAEMPSLSDVPEKIIPLLGQNAIELGDTRWNHDIQKLIDSIDSIRQRGKL